MEGTGGNPEIVGVNAIRERVAELSAGEPKFRNIGQQGVRNGNHRGRLDALFESTSASISPTGNQHAKAQLSNGDRSQEDLVPGKFCNKA